jgi:hypothetical protein
MGEGPHPLSASGEDGASATLSKEQVVRLVHRCAAELTPLAVVRFLEGEGRLLVADPSDKTSMKVAIRKLRRQTGLTFSPGEMLKVRALVMKALDEADVVGIQADESFHEEHLEWMDRIADVYRSRLRQGRDPALVTHSRCNGDLYEALPSLLDSQKRVSAISCRDLRPTLEGDYGVTDVAIYQIPSQYVVRGVDGPYEQAMHDVAIWPDFYQQLQARISVRARGEIFLIGAGLFGKELCIRVRERGGIALDMGSALDRMAGKTTRGRKRPKFQPLPKTPRVV